MSHEQLHPAALDGDRLYGECEVRRQRRCGPGGQHRNKVETAVTLVHRLTGTIGQASERRSQAANRRVALFRLRVNLALQVRRPIDADRAASDLWRRRCGGGRIVVRATHADFPALLAEALDVLSSRDMDCRSAAEALGCSVSQLTKLLKKEPRALATVNDQRRRLGRRALR